MISILNWYLEFDLVVNAAGGWAGGDLTQSPSDLYFGIETMWNMNTISAISAARIATTNLKEGGLLVFTGAAAALDGTPGMIAYGIAKAAVHQLATSVSQNTKFTTVSFLPITLDTDQNRKAMPSSDFSSWTPLTNLVDKTLEWVKDPSSRPTSGSLMKVETKDGVSTFTAEKCKF